MASDRHLHFIVRDSSYSQHPFYGYFLDNALQKVNSANPSTVSELLREASKALMLGRTAANMDRRVNRIKNSQIDILLEGVPHELSEKFLQAKTDKNADIETLVHEHFGPAMHKDFGLLSLDHLNTIKAVRELMKRPEAPLSGLSIVTPIEYEETGSYRKYLDILQANTSGALPYDAVLAFSYTMADGTELPLMKIGSPALLEAEFKKGYTGEESRIDEQAESFLNSGIRLAFQHPHNTPDLTRKLLSALEEQFEIIERPQPVDTEDLSPPKEKTDAIATMYWLLAQSTPVIRGGSAYANIILEHFSHRLREQGYEYDIPYMTEGTDLWAEAATQPLQRFKERFLGGEYFDLGANDEMVAMFQDAQLQNLGQQTNDSPTTGFEI